MIGPDWVNSPNRQYKAPLSLHADHDAVVTPMDPDDVTYRITRFVDVDDDLRDESRARGLRPSGPGLQPSGRPERRLEEQRHQADRERKERAKKLNISTTAQSVTPHREDVSEAVDAIDIRQLVRNHCADWEPTGRADHFNPGARLWRESNSGTGCFINPSKNIFVDSGECGGAGGPAKFMALVSGTISSPAESLRGGAYWEGVEALQRDGYAIPVWIPQKGSERSDGGAYDKTPL